MVDRLISWPVGQNEADELAGWQVDTLTRARRSREGASGHGDMGTRGAIEGRRELAPGFRRLKAEGLAPERPTTVAVTRHLE